MEIDEKTLLALSNIMQYLAVKIKKALDSGDTDNVLLELSELLH